MGNLGQPKGESPIFSTATNNVLEAMKSMGIRRYILITGLGVNAPGDKKDLRGKLISKMMKLMFRAITLDKQKELDTLSNSDRDWTLIRLPLIVESDSIGEVKVNLENSPGKKISTTDLANFIIMQIIDTQNIRKTPFISN